MSVFDLFRGFFSVPGGHYRGRRDPFFDAMTHDDDDDEEEEDGFYYEGPRGEQQDPFDSAWRFGFSLGPDGMKIQEPPLFGHVLREMEEIFSQMGHWDTAPESGHFGVPSIMPPPPPSEDRVEKGGGGSSGNPLRDFMLKTPDRDTRGPQPGPSIEPRHDGRPFSKFHDIWRQGPEKTPAEEHKEDRDLDSAVSARGLDQILTPPAGQTPSQPRIQSFFQSVSITKVVKPDGTVEERRTVRDGKGNEETTVTRSGGPGVLEAPDDRPAPVPPGGRRPFSDLRDDDSLFSKFFGGFK
nr:PREDICTED: HCLS1-associated protein X-1 isoform X1 [Paralichthys olivaceus]